MPASSREPAARSSRSSYDPPDVLRAFAAKHGITFPLLSDSGSAIIRRYGLLNTSVAPGDRATECCIPARSCWTGRAGSSPSTSRTAIGSATRPRASWRGLAAKRSGIAGGNEGLDAAPVAYCACIGRDDRTGIEVLADSRCHARSIDACVRPAPAGLSRDRAHDRSPGGRRCPSDDVSRAEMYHFKPLNEPCRCTAGRLVYQDVTFAVTSETRARARNLARKFAWRVGWNIRHATTGSATCRSRFRSRGRLR